MLKLLKISGHSLSPKYRDGDFVLATKIPYLFGSIREGDIVALQHDEYGTMIKQVQSVSPNKDEIFVIGTHKDSVDSRRFGTISSRDVLGKVIWHGRKPTQ